jgi:hypothetical protein
MDHFGIEEGLGVGFDELDQSLDQILRLGAGGVEKDSVSPVDPAEDLIFADEFLRVDLHHFGYDVIAQNLCHCPQLHMGFS